MADPRKPVKTVTGPVPPVAPVSPDTHNSSAKGSFETLPPSNEVVEGPDLRFLSPPQAKDELGRLGGYRILRVLGEGGMGLVLEAEDVRLKRRIALKVMRPEIAHREANRTRFLREAQAAAAVEHLNIIPIHQVGEENGVPFIAMPFLKGEPLNERLKRSRLHVHEILTIGWQTALGLAAAHARGLIHRDIKPGNIWLEEVVNDAGDPGEAAATLTRVRILDFGLARLDDEEVKLTASGAVMGTPAYMPPEQAGGETVDHRADIYSFGAVLYEMATGQPPFTGKTILALLSSLAMDIPAEPAQLNSQLPPALSQLIMKLLEKDPANRPQSTKAVAESLRKLLQDGSSNVAMALPPLVDADPWQDIGAIEDEETVTATPAKTAEKKRPNKSRSSNEPTPVIAARQSSQPNRKRPPAPGKAFPLRLMAIGLMVLVLGGLAVYQLAFKPKNTASPTQTEPPKEVVKNAPPEQVPKKDDPIIIKKADVPPVEPVVKGEDTSYDLGNGVKLDMVKIKSKGKTFLIGSPKEEAERNPFEEKFDAEEQHEIKFGHDFSMGKYEVTQEQYEVIMGTNPSGFKGPKNAVEQVSWDNAQEFLKKLNEKFTDRKLEFRLPSEAEWEYACRAGTTTPFHFGKALNGTQANCNGTVPYGTAIKGAYLEKTTSVGKYDPNAFGLYDMHGNVREWCEDYYGPYGKSPKDGTAQNVKQSNEVRVLRGGSWFFNPWFCRSAFRSNSSPGNRGSSDGFRVVVSQD